MTALWDMGTVAAAKLPCLSTTVCGVRGSVRVVWPGKPVMKPRLWLLSAPRLSFTRYVGMLALAFPSLLLSLRGGVSVPWRLGLLQTTEVDGSLSWNRWSH